VKVHIKWSMVWLVAKRELRDQLRDWRILFPLLLLTLLFPVLMNVATYYAINLVDKYGATLIADRLPPFFLMVVGFFPMTVSLVVALESFVGEKERGTIEPLLSSPLGDWELYLGKFAASMIPPLAGSYLSIGIYLLILLYQGTRLPDLDITLILLLLTTVQAILMVSAAVVISTQSTSVRSANLLASFIVIPAALLIQGETGLIFWGNNSILWFAIGAILIMTALLMRLGVAHFERESLLGREIDLLNLRWIGQTFWQSFWGQGRSLAGWYRVQVLGKLKRLVVPILIVCAVGAVCFAAAYAWTIRYLPQIIGQISTEELGAEMARALNLPIDVPITFPFILGYNLRAVAIISAFGVFSFGVLGVLGYATNILLIGAALAVFSILGFSPLSVFLAGILPHGIFEIPALIISCAVVLYMGAVLVTPDRRKTLGEVMISALGDWACIHLGLVLPLLAAAAAIETWITPLILFKTIL